MFTMLQEFVQALVGNSMLLMVVVAIPIGAGALVFYVLAREPVRPELGGWLGRLTRRGRRAMHRRRHRTATGLTDPTDPFDPLHPSEPGCPQSGPPVGAFAAAPANQVTFIDPYQDEDADDVYEIDDIEAGQEAEDDVDTLTA